MKIFLTGASGLVGSNVAKVAARRGHEVLGTVGHWPGSIEGATRILAVNLSEESAIQRAVLDWFPDAIINAAAISEAGASDAQPEISRRLNVALPASLAQLAHHLGARFVHISSEQAFDGKHPPYRVADPVSPVSLYGRQKVEAEECVSRFAPETSVSLRLPLMGGNSLSGTRSIHERLFARWAAGKPARLFSDEIRQPCTAENAAEVIVELCERTDFRGILHWAGAEALSRVEIGRRIAAHFKITNARIEEALRADDPANAWRQPDLTLDCAPLEGVLKTRRESFAESLEKLAVPPPCRAWYRSLAG